MANLLDNGIRAIVDDRTIIKSLRHMDHFKTTIDNMRTVDAKYGMYDSTRSKTNTTPPKLSPAPSPRSDKISTTRSVKDMNLRSVKDTTIRSV